MFRIALFVALATPSQPNPVEKITLQYRCSRDAFAPSQFVAVLDGNITLGLDFKWDLPEPQDGKEREKQAAARNDFDALIKKLEAGNINGVEFEARGEWLRKGAQLRLTTIPQLTEAGKRRMKGP